MRPPRLRVFVLLNLHKSAKRAQLVAPLTRGQKGQLYKRNTHGRLRFVLLVIWHSCAKSMLKPVYRCVRVNEVVNEVQVNPTGSILLSPRSDLLAGFWPLFPNAWKQKRQVLLLQHIGWQQKKRTRSIEGSATYPPRMVHFPPGRMGLCKEVRLISCGRAVTPFSWEREELCLASVTKPEEERSTSCCERCVVLDAAGAEQDAQTSCCFFFFYFRLLYATSRHARRRRFGKYPEGPVSSHYLSEPTVFPGAPCFSFSLTAERGDG